LFLLTLAHFAAVAAAADRVADRDYDMSDTVADGQTIAAAVAAGDTCNLADAAAGIAAVAAVHALPSAGLRVATEAGSRAPAAAAVPKRGAEGITNWKKAVVPEGFGGVAVAVAAYTSVPVCVAAAQDTAAAGDVVQAATVSQQTTTLYGPARSWTTPGRSDFSRLLALVLDAKHHQALVAEMQRARA